MGLFVVLSSLLSLLFVGCAVFFVISMRPRSEQEPLFSVIPGKVSSEKTERIVYELIRENENINVVLWDEKDDSLVKCLEKRYAPLLCSCRKEAELSELVKRFFVANTKRF